jgi:hypothetical protein
MVAQQSVRTVTYNVTRMEQFHTVQKVPISRVVMVPEDITVQRPVTVYRTIPIGTSVAWVPSGSLVGGTATALGPTPDRLGMRRSELKAVEKLGERIGKEKEKDKYERQNELNMNQTTPGDLNRNSEIVIPPRKTSDSTSAQVSQRVPSAVLVNGWMARNRATNGEAPNGFVCIVERSWTSAPDPDFWNPKVRTPICFNAAAAPFLPSTHHQKDRLDPGGTHESSDGRNHRGRHRQKRTAGDGTRGDVLHDVEARIRRRQRQTLASPPHVLLFADRPRNLGSESAGLSHLCF